jgi:tRNA dimethylallyltransferase
LSSKGEKKAIVIAGATGVGKSDYAINLALELDTEIISADARQIYRGMVIGTSAPENSPIKHHLVGILDPRERSTAAHWANEAFKILEELHSRGKTPLVVGGTGLYIRALVEGIFAGPGADPEIRNELRRKIADGFDIHAELKRADPISAEKIHPENKIRIIRALEIFYITGKPLSSHFSETRPIAEGWTFSMFHLTRPREELYDRINRRTVAMLANGWLDETRSLLDDGISETAPGFDAIGYREICAHFRGEISFADLTETISRATRNYAKRQITWFRNRKGFNVILPGNAGA